MIRVAPRPVKVTLILGLLTCCPAALGQSGERSHDLAYEALPRWDLVLPREVWHRVGDELVLGGHRFAARPDGSHLRLDADADGVVDERVRGPLGFVQLRHPASGYRYALRLRRVEERWEWAPGGVLTGRVGADPVRLVDLDGDGLHASYGVDGLQVGRQPVGLLSRVTAIDGALAHFDLQQESRVTLRPFEGPLASLDVRSAFESNGELVSVLMRDGQVCLDVAAGRGKVRVPAGTWSLVSGRVARGAITARIAPGRLAPIELAPGEERVLAWGGPLVAEFSFDVQADQLTVHPDVRFYGRAGAEFADFAPVVRAPRLFVEDVETGQLVQYGHFGGCCGGGYSAWRATVPAGLRLTVRLEHRRKLFGPITGQGRLRGQVQGSR